MIVEPDKKDLIVFEHIGYFADKNYQESVWNGNDPRYRDDPIEMICMLEDIGFLEWIKSRKLIFDDSKLYLFYKFYKMLDEVDVDKEINDLIKSDEWTEIVNVADQIVRILEIKFSIERKKYKAIS